MNSTSTTNSVNPKFQTVIQFLSIYALFLIIIGTIGNILAIIVLTRRNLRRFGTGRYLICVSLCDLISLYGWNLNNFYKFNISRNFRNIEDLSLVHCRLISFMMFCALQLSSWCLSAVSLDRALGLLMPTWKQSYGKIRYTKYYILCLSVICLTVNSHILFFNGYRTSTGTINCYSTEQNSGYIYPQWQRVHLVLYNLFPFAIMLICNTYIIIVTVRSSRNQIESNPTNVNRKNLDRYRQFTLLLIIVTFAFVVLTLPACIYFVFLRNTFVSRIERTHRFMIQILVTSIQFTSHGINFFLYCFSAKTFRNELHEMFDDLMSCCEYFHRRSSISTPPRFHLNINDKNNNNVPFKRPIFVRQYVDGAVEQLDDNPIEIRPLNFAYPDDQTDSFGFDRVQNKPILAH